MALQNVEENSDVILQSKASLLQRPQTAYAVQRNTLGDIGNKVSAITISDHAVKKGPIKKEILQISTRQQKALSKSKATSSLRTLAETNVLPQVSLNLGVKLTIFCFKNENSLISMQSLQCTITASNLLVLPTRMIQICYISILRIHFHLSCTHYIYFTCIYCSVQWCFFSPAPRTWCFSLHWAISAS